MALSCWSFRLVRPVHMEPANPDRVPESVPRSIGCRSGEYPIISAYPTGAAPPTDTTPDPLKSSGPKAFAVKTMAGSILGTPMRDETGDPQRQKLSIGYTADDWGYGIGLAILIAATLLFGVLIGLSVAGWAG